MIGVVGAIVLLVVVVLLAFWAPDRPSSELQARWAPSPSTFVTIMGMQVHVRDEGPRNDPTPLVLLHGTASSLHTWEGWASLLRQERRVISVDLPGCGLTGPSPDGDYTTEAYLRFLDVLLQRLGVSRHVLVGSSLGGEIAWTASLTSANVERLILVNSAGYPLQPSAVSPGMRFLATTPGLSRIMEVTLPRPVLAARVRRLYGDPSKVTPQLIDRYYELSLREGNRRAYNERFAQAQFGATATRIRDVRVPTLILWGARDPLLPSADAGRFRDDIAGSRLVVFEDLGHLPHEEDPKRTAVVVEEFLRLPLEHGIQ